MSGRLLELRGPSGHVRERVRALGERTPALLCRGGEIYVHSGIDGVLDVLRPGDSWLRRLAHAGALRTRLLAEFRARYPRRAPEGAWRPDGGVS